MEQEHFFERERDLLLPPCEHERFAERERDRLDRERERFFPHLEQERFLERDLDRLLPTRIDYILIQDSSEISLEIISDYSRGEIHDLFISGFLPDRERFFEPERDLDLEQLLARERN